MIVEEEDEKRERSMQSLRAECKANGIEHDEELRNESNWRAREFGRGLFMRACSCAKDVNVLPQSVNATVVYAFAACFLQLHWQCERAHYTSTLNARQRHTADAHEISSSPEYSAHTLYFLKIFSQLLMTQKIVSEAENMLLLTMHPRQWSSCRCWTHQHTGQVRCYRGHVCPFSLLTAAMSSGGARSEGEGSSVEVTRACCKELKAEMEAVRQGSASIRELLETSEECVNRAEKLVDVIGSNDGRCRELWRGAKHAFVKEQKDCNEIDVDAQLQHALHCAQLVCQRTVAQDVPFTHALEQLEVLAKMLDE